MVSGSAVLFTSCLYDVALQHRCLLYDGPRDVLITCWGLEKDFLAWGEFWKGSNSVCLVELVTLGPPF